MVIRQTTLRYICGRGEAKSLWSLIRNEDESAIDSLKGNSARSAVEKGESPPIMLPRYIAQPGRSTGRVLGCMLLASCVMLFPRTKFSARQPEAPDSTPEEVVKHLCTVDANGTRLTPKGWQEASELFLHPQPFPAALAIRIARGVCANMAAEDVGAEVLVGVDYLGLGRLDASMHFTWAAHPNSGPMKWRYFYTLVSSDAHRKFAPGGGAPAGNKGPAKWKIKTFQPEPIVSVDAATQYVTGVLKGTKDPVVKRNAERTLAILRKIGVR
jgi:hypothetical protein